MKYNPNIALVWVPPMQRERGPYVTMHSGAKAFPLNPDRGDVRMADVCRTLATTWRWRGATQGGLYSVAEHSLRVAAVCRQIAIDQGLNRWGVNLTHLCGLLHDSGEYLFPDMPRPIKGDCFVKGLDGELVPYDVAEMKVTRSVVEACGVSWAEYESAESIVKLADDAILYAEARDLVKSAEWWRQKAKPEHLHYMTETITPGHWGGVDDTALALEVEIQVAAAYVKHFRSNQSC